MQMHFFRGISFMTEAGVLEKDDPKSYEDDDFGPYFLTNLLKCTLHTSLIADFSIERASA